MYPLIDHDYTYIHTSYSYIHNTHTYLYTHTHLYTHTTGLTLCAFGVAGGSCGALCRLFEEELACTAGQASYGLLLEVGVGVGVGNEH